MKRLPLVILLFFLLVGASGLVSATAGWRMMGIPKVGPVSQYSIRFHYGANNYTWNQSIAAGILLGQLFTYDYVHRYYVYMSNTSNITGYAGYWCYLYDLNYQPWVAPDGASYYNHTMTITLSGLPASSFLGWSGDIVNSSENITVLVDDDMAIVGSFNVTTGGSSGTIVIGRSGYGGSVMLTLGLVCGTTVGGFGLSGVWRKKKQ